MTPHIYQVLASNYSPFRTLTPRPDAQGVFSRAPESPDTTETDPQITSKT